MRTQVCVCVFDIKRPHRGSPNNGGTKAAKLMVVQATSIRADRAGEVTSNGASSTFQAMKLGKSKARWEFKCPINDP